MLSGLLQSMHNSDPTLISRQADNDLAKHVLDVGADVRIGQLAEDLPVQQFSPRHAFKPELLPVNPIAVAETDSREERWSIDFAERRKWLRELISEL